MGLLLQVKIARLTELGLIEKVNINSTFITFTTPDDGYSLRNDFNCDMPSAEPHRNVYLRVSVGAAKQLI
jgi:hypothetical protein